MRVEVMATKNCPSKRRSRARTARKQASKFSSMAAQYLKRAANTRRFRTSKWMLSRCRAAGCDRRWRAKRVYGRIAGPFATTHLIQQGIFMHDYRHRLTLAGVIGFAAALSGTAAAKAPTADLIVTGGAIYTENEAHSTVEAMAIRNGNIVFTGSASEAL